MITVISGTNRRASECLTFARTYQQFLQMHTDEEVRVLALEDIPHDWFHPDMYESEGQSASLARLQDEYMIPATRFVYVLPEYNGGFPGVVKLFIDACSVRQYQATFRGKKAALIGIASGRAGNLRGLDHMTGVLHHLGNIILPNKLPISRIEHLMNKEGKIVDEATLRVMELHAREFVGF